MHKHYTLELIFLILVIALSVAGFSTLVTGGHGELTPYHMLHVVTSFGWLTLLTTQLVLLREKRASTHRTLGQAVLLAGPVLAASLALLTVHSAAKDAAVGRSDFMVVQNVLVTVEVALLIFLAVLLRKNRGVHAALLLSTALLFMGIALFFTLIGYVPGFRATVAGTAPRFAEAGQAVAFVGGAVALLFFVRNWRTGWPWLLTGSFFFVNGLVQMLVAKAGQTLSLTQMVASIERLPSFVLGLVTFSALLWLAWRVGAPPSRPTSQLRE